MKTNRKGLSVRSILAICFAVVVVATVITGILLLDSPAQERLRRLDERRVSDLREISYAVDVYWTREGSLPSSLKDLSDEERVVRELADPETGDPYEYRVLGEKAYALCAVFALDTGTDERDAPYLDFWSHGPGRQCFQLEAQDVSRVPEMR